VTNKPITIVCTFYNGGEVPLNVSGIMGSMNDPMDFSRFYNNFTGNAVGEVVDPGSELALEYRFFPNVRTAPGRRCPARLPAGCGRRTSAVCVIVRRDTEMSLVRPSRLPNTTPRRAHCRHPARWTCRSR
jgi:hypothetical protein